jgi:fatty-acyl-CoA synthase
MNIFLAGDSRCACPPRPNSWPHLLEGRLRPTYPELNIEKFFAVEDTYIFTMFLLADKLKDYPDDHFDFAIIHSGWHDYMESWPRRILDSLVPEGIEENCIIDDTAQWVDSYKDKEKEYIYKNEKRLIEINELLKRKCKHLLYIGIHTLIDGSDLHKKTYQEHQFDLLESNDFFSNLSDFLNLPQHYSWNIKNTTPDRIHHTVSANVELANKLNRYITLRDVDLCKILNHMQIHNNNYVCVENDKLIFKDFINKCKRCASHICNHTNKGDIVLIDGETSMNSIASFVGCFFYGRIPMFTQRPTNKVSELEYGKKMQHTKDLVSPALCVSDHEDRYPLFKVIGFEETDILEEEKITSDDVAFVQLSSGTTGLPKLMKVHHKDLINHIADYQEKLNCVKGDTIVSWLPLYHDMGLIGGLLVPILSDNSLVLIDPFSWLSNPNVFIEKIKEHRGTYSYLPNFALNYIYERCSEEDLSFMKFIISCSEPTSHKYIERFSSKFSVPVRVCYALAENIFAVSISDINPKLLENTISCGEIIDNVSVLIMKDGRDVTEKETGKVLIKSNYSANGDEFGYYDTGDVGFINDGELYIVGRSKDNFVSFGKNIYPDRIEEIVSNIDEVKDGRCACFGIYDEQIGTHRLHICLETKENVDDNIQIKVRNIVEEFSGIPPVLYINDNLLVKTSSGKVSRSGTRENITNSTKDG